jgi:hypothetical protein
VPRATGDRAIGGAVSDVCGYPPQGHRRGSRHCVQFDVTKPLSSLSARMMLAVRRRLMTPEDYFSRRRDPRSHLQPVYANYA